MKRIHLAVFLLLALAAAASAAVTNPVHVEQGLISGIAGKNPDVRVYRGIPFAAPPVGDLRWKAPQPPASWQDVRAAAEEPHACWQTQYPAAASLYQAKLPPLSEDCLYLNVWTTAKSAKDRLPVMVWIHGGGFTRGSGTGTAYDGEILARKGVVLVTMNYRLGVFGFFAHPGLTQESGHHASGNYGLLDQIAALQWVQKNIAAFGGDPKRVTIFGESAGSWAVSGLMASPLAKGLFQRSIGESGGQFADMDTLTVAEKAGEKLAATMKADQGSASDAVKALRAIAAEELLKATDHDTVRAIVDGFVLPQSVANIFAAGKQSDVPLLIGSNADEGTSLAPQAANLTAAIYISGARMRYGKLADAFLALYPGESDEQAVKSFYAAYRDQAFGWEMRTWARMQTKAGHQPVYLYYFTRPAPGPLGRRFGAFHALEIAYVFGNFPWPFPWEEADHKLSDTITGYWTNFAKTGDPNGEGLPRWPVYSASTDQVLELGDKIAVRSETNKAGLDFYDNYFQSLKSQQQQSVSGGSHAK
ncbi:MAG TPA: carboxylesterase family protein [Candidatus Angelobacter sp.]